MKPQMYDLVSIDISSHHNKYGPGAAQGIVIKVSDTANGTSYGLFLEHSAESYWYDENTLHTIATRQETLLADWTIALAIKDKQESDLDGIFAQEFRGCLSEPSVAALAACFTPESLWGTQGEGVTYGIRARQTLSMAKPFLIAKDKEGWLKYCREIQKS